MKNPKVTVSEEIQLANLIVDTTPQGKELTPGEWITLLRKHYRMSQTDLAKRANITRANLLAIELGKADPRISTLQRIYQALSCQLRPEPHPQKPLEKIIRGRAREIAKFRLDRVVGAMAREGQAPDKKQYKKILKKRTEEILQDPRARLWQDS